MGTRRLSVSRHLARGRRMLEVGMGIALLVLAQPAGAPGLPRSPSSHGSLEPIVSAQRDDLAYEEEMEKGLESMRRHKYEDALKSFKHASDMRDRKEVACFIWMAEAYQGLEAYKNVIENCDKAIELAGSDKRLRARAYNLKGIALQTQADRKDEKKLRDAEAAFRQGIELNSELDILHYNLGFTLLQQGHDPEGVAELKAYLNLQPNDPKADEARKLIDNPRRAREHYAAEFSFTTSNGEYVTLDDLRGKVVLLDFWGTWCPPCVASVPSLRILQKKFQKEPFVMIGISSDSDTEKWRDFTARNQMVWWQYLDRNRRIQTAFEIRAFPTYILIDHEGIVRFRSSGSGLYKDASLEDAIRKQLKMATKAPVSGVTREH